MPIKSIGIKSIKIKLKSDRFKKHAQKAKEYAPSPIGAGLYGTSLLATGKLAKYSYKASQVYGSAEIPVTIFNIVRKAYRSEAFYKASWKIKSQILAKKIANSPVIQRNIAEATLSAIIYEIIKRNKNRQGTEKLAEDIDKAIMEHEIRNG